MGSNAPASEQQASSPAGEVNRQYNWRFGAIIFSLSLTSILAGLEIGCIPTAMPAMVADVGSPDMSQTVGVWVANSYFLTMTALQPLYGQVSDNFGRRTMTLLAVFLFVLSSAIAAPATSLNMLIAGRDVMGAGGGGILVMLEIIICDLCPQRDRPKYLGMVMSLLGVTMALGPLIGGALAEYASWRWIFWLNLPVAAVSAVPLGLLLKVRYQKAPLGDMLRRVDWGGNALFGLSVTSILLSLTWGGTEHGWSLWRTLVPLLLGIAGLAAFLVLESTRFVPQPTMPLRLFANRTSAGAFGLTFLASLLTYWISYYLPVYFQAVLEATPTRSGIDLLPVSVICIPFSIAVGGAVTRTGRFRPFQFAGIILLTISVGVLSLLDMGSSMGYWVGFQVIAAEGIGILLTCTLPAVQAPLPEADVAVATATWDFLRSFGGVWGVAIPAAVFNSRINVLLGQGRVDDGHVQELMRDGGAYALAVTGFVRELDSDTRDQVKSLYVDALRLVWPVGIAFSLLGFLVTLVIKEVRLREDLETDFGLEGEPPGKQAESGPDTSTAVIDHDDVEKSLVRREADAAGPAQARC